MNQSMLPGPAAYAPADVSLHAARIRRHQQRAETYLHTGQADAAIATLEAILDLQPDHIPTLLRLCELHLGAGRHGYALGAAHQALNGNLDGPEEALWLVRLLAELSESGLIVEIARQLPPSMWDGPQSLAEMAHLLGLIGAFELASQFAQAAVARDPDHPPALYALATQELFYGDFDSAARHAEHCLSFLPDDHGTHWLLSRLRLPDPEKRVQRIQRVLDDDAAKGSTDLEREAWLAYALHNELHELGDHDRAWQALERACRAKRASLDYDPAEQQALFDTLCQWSAEDIAVADGCDDPRLTPVFVIGLHRSGTTLAERILGGHSHVRAGGETYDIRAQLRRASGAHFPAEIDLGIVRGRNRLDYRAIGQGYLQGIAWRARGMPLVTDKLPSNYFNVGFIARALPRARFVLLHRDPVDVGLSSLRTLFSHACPYSYDQAEYVAHYRNFRRLVDHWRAVLPDRILDVHYHDLVNAPEETAARMARFCGLDYEPAMIDIAAQRDAVATASSTMMRDGIRRDRDQLRFAYEKQLAPMIAALAS